MGQEGEHNLILTRSYVEVKGQRSCHLKRLDRKCLFYSLQMRKAYDIGLQTVKDGGDALREFEIAKDTLN